ncbi:hypothetical protein [Streptomyces sp. NPDC058371]|uniref:hypothetical protein n=1 Tax=Streptomyces sp. NPDC058371 TaxID=3346463 RepID=UPI00364EEF61
MNHGPDGQDLDGQGPDGLGPDIQGVEGLGSDELALRRMLHDAVQEIEPSDGTLEHLRRAVPARRARKRQAVVGMAAAALFIGTAVPALVHVSNSSGSNANPSVVGNTEEAQGGAGRQGQDGSGGSSGGSGKSHDKGKQDKGDKDKGKGASGGAVGGVNPSASIADALSCTAAQLGNAAPAAGSPDSAGVVYGSFTISNVSGTACSVAGAGSVGAGALGAADQSKVTAARHTAGDGAAGLPDPSAEAISLVLQPGGTYVVKFAWVPSAACPPAGGGSGGPSPDPTPTDGTTGSGGTSTDAGVSSQLVREEGTVDGSVAVSYTADAGSPSTSTVVSNACSGTVYWTGLLAGS